MSPDLLAEPELRTVIDRTASAYSEAMTVGLRDATMPAEMTRRMQEDIYVFSGFKTYHSLKEASLLLRDEQGLVKPFDRFYKDVADIDAGYNKHYLQAEYIFATQSARMAAKWADFEQSGDRYDLQYRTAGDDKVREAHAALDLVTLPPSDPFWAEFFPPNGWRCRCNAVQVRRDKYPRSNPDTALIAGREATAGKEVIFRFNPGKQACIFPKHHPYYGRKGYAHCSNPQLAGSRDGFDPCPVYRRMQELIEKEGKSKSAAERKANLEAMRPLLKASAKVDKTIPMPDGSKHTVGVGFTKEGNKHLYSDTMGRAKGVLKKEDLPKMGEILKGAKLMDVDGRLYKGRKDNITRFYYFETELRGKPLYLHVAEETNVRGARNRSNWFLYAATAKKPGQKRRIQAESI